MNPPIGRRAFLSVGAASAASLAIGAEPGKAPGKRKPLVIATINGESTATEVMRRLREGSDPLDAIIEGVAKVENDPNDHSIGAGGFPNMAGVIELDALVMHGPTHGVGAVAALRNIVHPAAVARAVMQKTPNCLFVGDGALQFAKAVGFPETDLMTPEMRKLWETARKLSGLDKSSAATFEEKAAFEAAQSKYSWLGAINCLALDTHGDLAGLSMNPGLAFKIPGRVGDTPIPGAGLYVDNEVGACGSTGTGELNVMNCSCFQVVENLRRGLSPKEACLEACKRVAQVSRRNPRYRTKGGKFTGYVSFYCMNKAGQFGGASINRAFEMVVDDGSGARLVPLAVLPR